MGKKQGRAGFSCWRGFTLIEMVVSLLIFAVLSVLAWQGLYQVVRTDQVSRAQVAEQNAISRAWAILTQDFLHLRSRPVRNEFGDLELAYQTGGQYTLKFSRGGLPLIEGLIPTGMQRVAYALNGDNELVRSVWPLQDGYQDEAARRQVLLDGVSDFRVEHLDGGNYFQANWPPLNEDISPGDLPRMIRITLETESGQVMERLMPGIATVLPESEGT